MYQKVFPVKRLIIGWKRIYRSYDCDNDGLNDRYDTDLDNDGINDNYDTDKHQSQ